MLVGFQQLPTICSDIKPSVIEYGLLEHADLGCVNEVNHFGNVQTL